MSNTSAHASFSVTGVPFQSPPNKAKSKVQAPPIGPLAFLLSLFQSGVSNITDLLNSVKSIPAFNWQNQGDIDKYLNPATRTINVDFWASAKQKPWNAKNTNPSAGTADNKTTSAYVGPVMNQGQIGICYSVSSADVLTMRYSIQNDLDNSNGQQLFSIKQIVSCSSDPNSFNTSDVGACNGQNLDCNGGYPSCVGVYIQNKGVGLNTCSVTDPLDQGCVQCVSTCSSDLAAEQTIFPIPLKPLALTLPNGQVETTNPVINYVQYYDSTGKLVNPKPAEQVTDNDRRELQLYMKTHLLSQGPMAVCFYVDESQQDGFMQYNGGIFRGNAQGTPNHAVTLVGWGTDPQYGEYWIVKNSWGTTWGDQNNPGYFNFAMSTSDYNSGYGLDYPQVVPAQNGSGGSVSCTSASSCGSNSLCLNGICYEMYGGGTGFLVNGMEPIDVSQLPNPVLPTSGSSGVVGSTALPSAVAPIPVALSSTGYQGRAGDAFLQSTAGNTMSSTSMMNPSTSMMTNSSMSNSPMSNSSMSNSPMTSSKLQQLYDLVNPVLSNSSGGLLDFNLDVLVVRLPDSLMTRSSGKRIDMSKLMKQYESCKQRSPQVGSSGCYSDSNKNINSLSGSSSAGRVRTVQSSNGVNQAVSASTTNNNAGLIAGVTVASVLGALFLILFAIYFSKYKKNRY